MEICTQTDINYPFYLYPGYPCAGYHNICIYNKNLKMLYERINYFCQYVERTNVSILFHLTIGACMEEYLALTKITTGTYFFQWQQLCPEHLRFHAKNGKKVVHFIVSPNKTFSFDTFMTPSFISQTEEFSWEITHENDITIINSKSYDFVVYVFCTMMPTIDNRNKKALEYFRNVKYTHPVDNIEQTENDKLFVVKFYNCLNLLFGSIVKNYGTVTCFSFCVFHENSNKKKYNNYTMFKELKTQILWNNPNMFLGEWTFFEGCYIIIDCSRITYRISYVDFSEKSADCNIIRLENNGKIMFPKPIIKQRKKYDRTVTIKILIKT